MFLATHTGLFRVPRGSSTARRVADRYQDTMGFTVVGPRRFLGSGHPDLREGKPPFLGLIESRDAGETWKTLSLEGDWDFHILKTRGRRVYGYGSNFKTRDQALLVSRDGGRRWQPQDLPDPVISLAVDPSDADHLVASGATRLLASEDGGRGWGLVTGKPGLLVWLQGGLVAITFEGEVRSQRLPGGPWRRIGNVGGQPEAFDQGVADELLVALNDGTVKSSRDGGRTWSVRFRAPT